ncbi:MAG: carbohydrate binding domain-containing protein [Candidatus Omnitrophota bacterium]|nr:carbohydrate binding domain-containing protein [Candidatus Omnitrophota bacterium]
MVKIKSIKGIFLVLIFLTLSPISYANVLTNPGFESGEDSWYNWDDGNGTNSGVISGEYIHEGQSSAGKEISGLGSGAFGQIIPVNPGETVKVSAWIMSPDSGVLSNGAEAYVRIEFWDGMAPLGSGHAESIRINKATKWVKLKASGKAPSGATEARVLGFARGSTNESKGKVYFDDFEVNIEKQSQKRKGGEKYEKVTSN